MRIEEEPSYGEVQVVWNSQIQGHFWTFGVGVPEYKFQQSMTCELNACFSLSCLLVCLS